MYLPTHLLQQCARVQSDALANQESPCPGYYNGVLARASRDSLRAQVVSKVRTISVYQVISRPSSSDFSTDVHGIPVRISPAREFLKILQYQGRLCATLIPVDDARVTGRDVQHLFLKVPVSSGDSITYISRDSRHPKLPLPGRRLL